MSPEIARIISWVSLAFTVLMLLIAFWSLRRERRVRLRRDLLSLALSVGAIAVLGLLTSVTTRVAVAVLAIVAGLLLGVRRGSKLRARLVDGVVLAKHGRSALLLWGAGIVVSQVAAATVRAGVLRLGQAMAMFGAATALGVLVGRIRPIRAARDGAISAGVVVAVLSLLALGAVVAVGTTAASPAVAQPQPESGAWTVTVRVPRSFIDESFEDDEGGQNTLRTVAIVTVATVEVGADGQLTGSFTGRSLIDASLYDTDCFIFCDEAEAEPHQDEVRIGGAVEGEVRGRALLDDDGTVLLRLRYTPVVDRSERVQIDAGPGHDDDGFLAAVARALGTVLGDAVMQDSMDVRTVDEPRRRTFVTDIDGEPFEVPLRVEVVAAEPGTAQPADAASEDDASASESPSEAPSEDPSVAATDAAAATPPPIPIPVAGEGGVLGEVDGVLVTALAPPGEADVDLDDTQAALAAAAAAALAALAAAAAVGGSAVGAAGAAATGTGLGQLPPPELPPADDGPDEAQPGPLMRPDGAVWLDDGHGGGSWVSPDEHAAATEADAATLAGLAAEEVAQREADDVEAFDAAEEATVAVDMAAQAAIEARQAAIDAEREATRVRAQESLTAMAEESGQPDLLERLREGTLTPDELGRVLDALQRRERVDAGLTAVGADDEWIGVKDVANAVLGSAADAARLGGQPALAALLEHPTVAARLAAAIISGGWSEIVAGNAYDMGTAALRLSERPGLDPTTGDYVAAMAKEGAIGLVMGDLLQALGKAGKAGLDSPAAREALERLIGPLDELAAAARGSGDALSAGRGASHVVEEAAVVGGRNAALPRGPVTSLRQVANADALTPEVRAAREAMLEEAEVALHRGERAVLTQSERAAMAAEGAPIGPRPADAPSPYLEVAHEMGPPRGSTDPVEVAAREAEWAANVADAERLVRGVEEATEAVAAARTAGDAAAEAAARARLTDASLSLQESKQGLQLINEQARFTDELRTSFNDSMRGVYEQADRQVVDRLAAQEGFGPMQEIGTTSDGTRVFADAQGRQIHLAEPTNPTPGAFVKSGADRDYTARAGVRTEDGVLAVRDLDRAATAPVYEEAFFEAAGGRARFGDMTPAQVARSHDQMVTDAWFEESYGRNAAHLRSVLHGGADALPPDVADQIGRTMGHKGHHWFANAPAGGRYEDHMAEGFRQVVKQADSQVARRLRQLNEAFAAKAPPGVDPRKIDLPVKLREAVQIMGTARPGHGAVAPVEIERQLAAMEMTPSDVATKLGDFFAVIAAMKP